MATNEALDMVGQALRAGNCGKAISRMENYLAAWPEAQTAGKLAELREDYALMENYWRRGAQDPQREEMYGRLLQRMYVLWANVAHHERMKASPYQHSLYTRVRQAGRDWSLAAIRKEMEDFVSSVAMLQLEPENKRATKSSALYKDHQRRMNELFEYVLTSRQWTDTVGREFAQMLTSPTMDSMDQQLLTAAVTLAAMNQFDMAKFRTLTYVYRTSQDEAVRQRALVGWALTMSDDYRQVYPEQRAIVEELLRSEETCQELEELQIQLTYCMEEASSSRTIRKEIMPDLIANSSRMMSEEMAEKESDEERLEEVLHPELQEERMEKVEASMRRMMNMEKEGVDIFFEGFSQMKRYPFFYDISNWVVPFYMSHPDISQYLGKEEHRQMLHKVFGNNTFCNSDKYSFVIALDQVMHQLPQQMRDMVLRGEVAADELPGAEPSATQERRLYLMDLYRFFKLFPHRGELYNPFDATADEMGGCLLLAAELLGETPMEGCKMRVVRQLRRHNMGQAAERLLKTVAAEYRDVQYYLWTKNYAKALQLDAQNERAMQGMGRQAFDQGRYEEALQWFERLLAVHPEKVHAELYVAICLVQLERYEEALKLLYKLNYEQPEDDGVSRVMAWALTCQGRTEQAADIYERLTGGAEQKAEDLKNYGYCLWLKGDVDRAAEMLRQYRKGQEATDNEADWLDAEWLTKRGITPVEVNMMLELTDN